MFQILALYLYFDGAKNSPLSPYFWFWRTLEVPDRGLVSLLCFGCGHSSLIHPCSKFWLFTVILKVKRIPMSQVLIWGFGGRCRFLTGDWYLVLDLDMVTGL